MASELIRAERRSYDQIRPLKVTYDIYNYAAGSTLFEMGNTKVLCGVTLQQGVPHFLRGKKSGWLTAEYSILPPSTPVRTVREVTANKRNGRNIEISRLIGRCLRSVVNLVLLNEQTIFIDCDVLQADGGTRTACITGAFLALRAATTRWIDEGLLSQTIILDELAAISTGLSNNFALLDLDFVEDNSTEADFNFVLTRSGKLIEIQGAAEHLPINWNQYENMRLLAMKGVDYIFNFYDNNPYKIKLEKSNFLKASKSLFQSLFD